MRRAMKYSGLRSRQLACVFARRLRWHSDAEQDR